MKTNKKPFRQIQSAFLLLLLLMIHLGVAALMINPGSKDHLPVGTGLNQWTLAGMTVEEAVDHVKGTIPPLWSIVFLDEEGHVVEEVLLATEPLAPAYPYDEIREDLKKLLPIDWKENWTQTLRGDGTGRVLDYALAYDMDYLKSWTLEQQGRMQRDPVDATIEVVEGVVVYQEEINGRALDQEGFLREIRVLLRQGNWDAFHYPLDPILPGETLESLGDFSQTLAVFNTHLQEDDDRRTNIRLAGEKLNNQRIMPGEAFSFNQAVGETLAEEGYLPAPVIANGQVVTGIGGGVCQVSSTFYQAALRAGFIIEERWHHTVPVGYLPLGMDAAVSYGTRDLVVVNPYDQPVLVGSWIENGAFHIALFGDSEVRSPQVKIEVRSQREIPPGTQVVEDRLLDTGVDVVVQEGTPGHWLQVFRTLEQVDGNIVEELISVDVYPPVERIIRRGTGAAGTGKK